MKNYNKQLGDFGEAAAAAFLKDKGYKIKAHNFYATHGELDIIAENKRELVFVEVKTRSATEYGYPAEAVNAAKLAHIRHAAAEYLEQCRTKKEIRFDVVEVYAKLLDGVPEVTEINHIENIIMQ